ncbi:MAG: substrate-binding domain-containing protein [Candidatus Sumerlaeota bacterium]|nr:substrate-binding domain-containing protein [Candidatus Sumerlaeota bacterium]
MATRQVVIGIDVAHGGLWNSLFQDSLQGILRYASSSPSWKLFFNDGPLKQRGGFSRYEDLETLGAMGLITYGRLSPSEIQRVKALRIPVVAIQTGMTGAFPSVQTDFAENGRIVGEHLLDRGFRGFGFVGNLALPSIAARYEGFAQTVQRRGRPCAWFSVRQKDDGEPRANRAEALRRFRAGRPTAPRENSLDEWLAGLPKPVGIMASSDRRAQSVLGACKRLGLAVPDDAAIVGVESNALICESMRPALSSVDVNGERIGFEAAGLLDRLMNGEKAPDEPVWIPPRSVVVRASSNALAVGDRAVRAAVEYIARNLENPIGLNDIVRASGVSCATLESRFHQNLDRTVNEELVRQRLDRAKRLMIETDLSLARIAEISGFRYSYFRNVFAAAARIPPGQWRREHR